MTKVFDVHSHYMPPEVAQHTAFFKVGWSDLARQLKVMDENGIETALLLYPTSDAHLNLGGWQELSAIYNEKISEAVKAHPDRFIGAGILPMDQPQAVGEELKKIEDRGLKALSLASSYDGVYLDDPRFEIVYAFCLRKKIPIHVHPQIMHPIGEERVQDPLLTPVLEYVFDVSVCIGKMMMSGVFSKFPGVNFVFAHYGGVLPFVKERFDNTYTMLRKRNFVKDLQKLPSEYFQNLYIDTSGSKSRAALFCALELVDASRILFGSDFPANQSMAQSIAVVKEDPSFRNIQDQVLAQNARNLFK